MALPLPQPGSYDIISALDRVNALTQANQAIEKARIENQYLPIKTLAQAASQTTYSNLMGPQFTAKLFGNPKIWANIPEKQKQEIQNALMESGQSQNPLIGQLNKLMQQGQPGYSTGNPLLDLFINKVSGGKFSQPQNALAVQPQGAQNVQGNILRQPAPQINWTSSNQDQNLPPSPENPNEGQMQPTGNQNRYSYTGAVPPTQMTSAQNVGTSEGVTEENKELGRERAKGISELDDRYEASVNATQPINDLITLAKNPNFQNLRKYPGFQSLQLSGKANFGNPLEQKLIGDFQVAANTALKAGILDFRGRILDKEIGIQNKLKIEPSDPIGVMIGKLPSIKMYNELSKQRDKLAADIMESEHIRKGKALEKADKQLNGDKIRKQIEEDLERSQMITLTNPKTGKQVTIPLIEAYKGGYKGG